MNNNDNTKNTTESMNGFENSPQQNREGGSPGLFSRVLRVFKTYAIFLLYAIGISFLIMLLTGSDILFIVMLLVAPVILVGSFFLVILWNIFVQEGDHEKSETPDISRESSNFLPKNEQKRFLEIPKPVSLVIAGVFLVPVFFFTFIPSLFWGVKTFSPTSFKDSYVIFFSQAPIFAIILIIVLFLLSFLIFRFSENFFATNDSQLYLEGQTVGWFKRFLRVYVVTLVYILAISFVKVLPGVVVYGLGSIQNYSGLLTLIFMIPIVPSVFWCFFVPQDFMNSQGKRDFMFVVLWMAALVLLLNV